MPQPNTYGQYGFAGYGAFPNQTSAAPGAPGAASPGMPQPTGAVGAGLGLTGAGQPGADLTGVAAAQTAPNQWAATDPNAYYSNYWGGKYKYLLVYHLIFNPSYRLLWCSRHCSAVR